MVLFTAKEIGPKKHLPVVNTVWTNLLLRGNQCFWKWLYRGMRMEKWGNGLIERLRFVTHNVLSYVCLCYLCLLSLLDKQRTNSLSTDTFVNLYFLAALKLLVSYFEVYFLECILIKSSSFLIFRCPWPTLDRYREDSPTYPMLITVFYY